MASNRELYLPIVQREAARAGVPWQLLDAVIQQESRYNPAAYNPGGGGIGAAGLAQLRGRAARDLGITPEGRFDPETSIRGGADYLALAYRRGGGNWDNAYALYHAGPYANLQQIPQSIWDSVGMVRGHAQQFGHTWQDASGAISTPAAETAAAAAGLARTPPASGVRGAPIGFRGIDYPESPQLPTVSNTLNLPESPAAPRQTRQLSLQEILGYANIRPPGWYPW